MKYKTFPQVIVQGDGDSGADRIDNETALPVCADLGLPGEGREFFGSRLQILRAFDEKRALRDIPQSFTDGGVFLFFFLLCPFSDSSLGQVMATIFSII